MKYGIYCIRDAKTTFLTPTVDLNDQSAMRNFAHATMQSNNLFNSHPQDYSLFRIGTFDSESGIIEPIVPEHIAEGVSFKEV